MASTDSRTLENSDFNDKYSWAKAPRFMNHAAEAGPLARVIMNANPANKSHQIQDPRSLEILWKKMGPSVFHTCLSSCT